MITVGIDEVGRGCWAGPLVAGAVVLDNSIAGLKDSKKLPKKRREALATKVKQEAKALGLGWVDAATIDEIGLTAAVKLAMERALAHIKVTYDEVIIDGHLNFLAEIPNTRAVIKADDSIPAVSAASIIAKVARDTYMAEIAERYPDYGFAHHVGYGTVLHLEKLKLYGVSDLHRQSYKPVRQFL